ncbi:MAG: glutamate--tRNA ligase [Candidatus Micrarchaeota archaeon]|nr:glutamate--tRNA ligase [Candidatus Micrarchaeota archaeon]
MLANKIREKARKLALKNAIDYGKADAGAVLSKVLSTEPRLKESIKELSQLVKEVVQEVNKMSEAALQKEFEAHSGEFEKIEKEKQEKSAKPRMELDGAVAGRFATRFAPEPNGYMQIGHAKMAWLGREFADKYRGTLALYFDDTNPEKEREEFVDAFKKDLEWLGIRIDREYYASDHIGAEYKYAEKLIGSGDAYVCTCDGEKMKKLRFDGEACEHRRHSEEQNSKLWKEMLDGKTDEDEGVLRLKLDMKSENTAMRDPVAFRIIMHEHYRQGNKYRVWPTYDFNTPIVDSLEGITDAMRTKEYELREELYYKILDLLGLRKPTMRTIARLEIADNITSKRKTNELIKSGALQGYDDPRLITIAGLRRRGVQPQAIKAFVLRFGTSNTNSEVSIDMLLAENRMVIDDFARRLFLVRDPVEVNISGVPAGYKSVKLNLHPSKSLGQREASVSDRLMISGSDARTLKAGSKFRFKDLFNVEIEKNAKDAIEAKFAGNGNIDAPKFQWVDAKRKVRCELLLIGPLFIGDKFNGKSLVKVEAYAEEFVNTLEKDEIVQFERVGFYKLDDLNQKTFIAL